MLRLLIFAVFMLLMSAICNGQGKTSFGDNSPTDTSFTLAQLKLNAYGGGADTMILIVLPNGTVKKVAKSAFSGGGLTLQDVLDNGDSSVGNPIKLTIDSPAAAHIELRDGLYTSIYYESSKGRRFTNGVGGDGNFLEDMYFIYDYENDRAPLTVNSIGTLQLGGLSDQKPVIALSSNSAGDFRMASLYGRIMLRNRISGGNTSDSTLVVDGDTIKVIAPIADIVGNLSLQDVLDVNDTGDNMVLNNLQVGNNLQATLNPVYYSIQGQWDTINPVLLKAAIKGLTRIGFDSTFTFPGGVSPNHAALLGHLYFDDQQNQRIPKAALGHPSASAGKFLVTGHNISAKDTVDKIAIIYGTEALPPNMTALESIGIDLGLGTSNNYPNANRRKTAALRLVDWDRGADGNIHIYFVTGDNTGMPGGNWGLYDSVGYPSKFKGRVYNDTAVYSPLYTSAGRMDIKTPVRDTLCIQCDKDSLTAQAITIFNNSVFKDNGGQAMRINPTFRPSVTGSSFWFAARIAPTIDQSSGHNGTTVAIDITPTLPSASDYISIRLSQSSQTAIYQTGTGAVNKFMGNTYFGAAADNGSTAKLQTTTLGLSGLAKYTSDLSGSYDSRSLVDKAYADTPIPVSINNQSGTTYALQASDNGKVIVITNASPITVTVPSGLPIGFNVLVEQGGAGKITFATSGTTINNLFSFSTTSGQYAVATLYSKATDTYNLSGNLE